MADGNPTWAADHARVTLFSQQVWTSDPAQILRATFVCEPEETTSKPAISERSAWANIDGKRRFEAKIAMNRLDLTVQPRFDVEPDSIPPRLPDGQAALAEIVEKISPWLMQQSQPVMRAALGMGALLESKSSVENYSTLSKLLPIIKLDGARHRDFQLRINTPMPSKVVEALTINTLATWSSVMVNAARFEAGPNVAPSPLATTYFVQALLDMNTDASRLEPFGVSQLAPLLQELLAGVSKLLAEGVA